MSTTHSIIAEGRNRYENAIKSIVSAIKPVRQEVFTPRRACRLALRLTDNSVHSLTTSINSSIRTSRVQAIF
jgi:hypothetical protein